MCKCARKNKTSLEKKKIPIDIKKIPIEIKVPSAKKGKSENPKGKPPNLAAGYRYVNLIIPPHNCSTYKICPFRVDAIITRRLWL